MREEEQTVLEWLVTTKKLDRASIHYGHGTPDFITPIGGFEVKRPNQNNLIIFTSLQLKEIITNPTISIVVAKGKEILKIIPSVALINKPREFEGIGIYYDDNDVALAIRFPAAMDGALEKLAEELGRSKSDLIREAAAALIGMYRNAQKS